jgi:hypothetical protein
VVRPEETVYEFLDTRVVGLKRYVEGRVMSMKKKQMRRDLLSALHNPRLRIAIVFFLESPNPRENYKVLMDQIYSAWRTEEHPLVTEDEPEIISIDNGAVEKKPVIMEKKAQLHAKTYFIAADLHFQVAGKSREFKKLSNNTAALEKFIRDRFGVTELPSTFRKLKGYSYQDIFDEHNESKTGQLRPHFRQIVENPQIFGEEIVKAALRIMDIYFL